MRTTLTLDPDVEMKLKRAMAKRKISLKQAVNEALRLGLNSFNKQQALPPFKVKPFSSGFQPGIDPYKLGQLLDQMDAEEYAKKWSK